MSDTIKLKHYTVHDNSHQNYGMNYWAYPYRDVKEDRGTNGEIRYPYLYVNGSADLLRKFIEIVESTDQELTPREWNVLFEGVKPDRDCQGDLAKTFEGMEMQEAVEA